MRQASAALIALLNSQVEWRVANLLTIVPFGAPIVRLTDADQDLTVKSWYDGATHLFSSSGPAMTCGPSKLSVGLQTDKKTITLACKGPTDASPDLFAGLPWPSAARQGYLDNATILVEKLLSPDWIDLSAGTLVDFWGQLSEPKISRYVVTLEVASWVEILLAQNFPRNVYQLQCLHTLFDAGCTLLRASYVVANAATAGSTASAINTTLAQADGYFDLGTITFTSGANNGLTRTVGTYASGVVNPIGPFPYAPAAADTFNIYPGCDKQQATCSGKFANLTHFRGYPYIPAPENAL